MIKRIKTLLKNSGLEWLVKGSKFYDIYLHTFYKSYTRAREKEINFYQTFLGVKKYDLIFDIGANGGDKTDRFLRMGANVICVEPDKYCCAILTKRFKNKSRSVTIVNKAVSEFIENKTFFVHQEGSAYNTLSEKWATQISQNNQNLEIVSIPQKYEIQTTTINDLISVYGEPHFIKIDIEGYEINALRGLNCKVPFITFELNLPEFRQEGIECIDRLSSIDPNSSFNYFIECGRGLELTKNINSEEFKFFLQSVNLIYMEVLCCMDCYVN
jgi:FkbM family methyltransferase